MRGTPRSRSVCSRGDRAPCGDASTAAAPSEFALSQAACRSRGLGLRHRVLVSADGTFKRVPTMAREVYDVVGAGDTVTAYLALILAAGGTSVEAAVIANFAAGVEVGKPGAATVAIMAISASCHAPARVIHFQP